MSSRADRTNCKFGIWCWKVEKWRDSQYHKVDRKENSRFCKKTLKQVYTQFSHYFKKKLLLPDTQIIIATMFNKSPHLFSIFVSFISVLSFAYHLSLITYTLFSILSFKISFINTFNWFLCLLWNAVKRCPHVFVKEQDFSMNQIRDV